MFDHWNGSCINSMFLVPVWILRCQSPLTYLHV